MPITKILHVILKPLNCFPTDGELLGTPYLGQNRHPRQRLSTSNGEWVLALHFPERLITLGVHVSISYWVTGAEGVYEK